jgi:4-carboxymuconolactone decarboxylase
VSGTRHDPAYRTAEIAGHPPRLDPPQNATAGPRASAFIERLRILRGLPDGLPLHPFYGTLGRSPEVFASYLQLGADLATETALDPRARELAILRTGWLCGAPYQFGEHVRIARHEGIEEAAIERVRVGSGDPAWDSRDRAVLSAAEELHADAMISNRTWAALSEHFDERQLIELLVLVGHYHLTAFIQNGLRVALNPDNRGLLAVAETDA